MLVAVCVFWLVLAPVAGTVLALVMRSAGGRGEAAEELGPPLYVPDVLAHRPADGEDAGVGPAGDLPRP